MAEAATSIFLSYTLLLLLALSHISPSSVIAGGSSSLRLPSDPPTFYDDPSLGYTLDSPMTHWDAKRRQWLELHPTARRSVLLISGSQAGPCENPVGDHLLLRLLKNKGDYCRVQGCELFYSMSIFDGRMKGYWSKMPSIRAAMVAHPEADWIFWVDSDAVVTDMDFKLPLHRYENYNLVVHGWPSLVFDEQSWTGLNAGVFLIRNCQWSLDFMAEWSSLGPLSPRFRDWARIVTSRIKGFHHQEHDDQAALVYLLANHGKWRDRIYIESDYYLQRYWVEVVPLLHNVSRRYEEVEAKRPALRRRRAEKAEAAYGEELEVELEREGVRSSYDGLKRPFITHFTGCQPCSGKHNSGYRTRDCWEGIGKALDFADDQILRNYGFKHAAGDASAVVEPLPLLHLSEEIRTELLDETTNLLVGCPA